MASDSDTLDLARLIRKLDDLCEKIDEISATQRALVSAINSRRGISEDDFGRLRTIVAETKILEAIPLLARQTVPRPKKTAEPVPRVAVTISNDNSRAFISQFVEDSNFANRVVTELDRDYPGRLYTASAATPAEYRKEAESIVEVVGYEELKRRGFA